MKQLFYVVTALLLLQAKVQAQPGRLTPGAALFFKGVRSRLTNDERNDIYRRTGFVLTKDGKQFAENVSSLDYPFDVVVSPTDLNKDGNEEIFLAYGNAFTSGNAGVTVVAFIKGRDGQYHKNLDFPGIVLVLPGAVNGGYPDLLIGGPGMQGAPIWRWNGSKYALYKRYQNPKKFTDIDVISKVYQVSIL